MQMCCQSLSIKTDAETIAKMTVAYERYWAALRERRAKQLAAQRRLAQRIVIMY